MTTKATTAPKKFKWNDDNRATVIAAYKAQIEVDHSVANSEAFLGKLAAEVGAQSARACRSMLATEKEYITLDAPKVTSTSNRISKGQIVRSIAKGLNIELDVLSSLDKANADALNALVTAVNGTLKAAGKEPITIA